MCQEFLELLEIWQVDSHLHAIARLYKYLCKSFNPIIVNEVRWDYGEKIIYRVFLVQYLPLFTSDMDCGR